MSTADLCVWNLLLDYKCTCCRLDSTRWDYTRDLHTPSLPSAPKYIWAWINAISTTSLPARWFTGRKREKITEGERERNRQTNRNTQTERQKHTDRYRDREGQREREYTATPEHHACYSYCWDLREMKPWQIACRTVGVVGSTHV